MATVPYETQTVQLTRVETDTRAIIPLCYQLIDEVASGEREADYSKTSEATRVAWEKVDDPTRPWLHYERLVLNIISGGLIIAHEHRHPGSAQGTWLDAYNHVSLYRDEIYTKGPQGPREFGYSEAFRPRFFHALESLGIHALETEVSIPVIRHIDHERLNLAS